MTTPPGADAAPRDGDGIELCVLIDGEEKPISHAVAFELAKIEANTYMEFYGDRKEARHAATVNALTLMRDGFPPWFANAYEVACHKYINHTTVI